MISPSTSPFPTLPSSLPLPDGIPPALASRLPPRPLALSSSNTPPSLPNEGPDAALTGSTRSLTRRLFALNLQANAAQSLTATGVPRLPQRLLA